MSNALSFFGFEPFVLGRTREQIKAAAGTPDAISKEVFLEGSAQETWRYEGVGVELDFVDDEDWRLASITIESTAITLQGTGFVGMKEEQLAPAAIAAGIPDLALTDDFAENGKCYDSDACGLTIWVLNGTVSNLTLFPQYDEAGEHPIWPAAN